MGHEAAEEAYDTMRDAALRYGDESAEARTAAIEFCRLCGIDPHYRYASWRRVTPDRDPLLEPEPFPAVEEWEIQVRRAAHAP